MIDWKKVRIVPLPYRNPSHFIPIQEMPPAWGGYNPYEDMGKQIQKTEVPPRDERLEQMGDPKPPKMGGITPTSIDLPDVDDLLEKMNKVVPKKKLRLSDTFKAEFISFDLETEFSRCSIGCPCDPCRRGECHKHVNAL